MNPTCDAPYPGGRGIYCDKIVGHDGPHSAVTDDGHFIGWARAVGEPDPVNHPSHYTSDPSGVECIQITRHRNFNVGNAIKYLWRAGLKDNPGQDARAKQIEDLRKAVWYINDEITRLEAS